MGYFSEGLSCRYDNGKYGYIDESGNFIIDAKFDDGEEFKEGLAPVKLKEKWGFINKKGKYIWKPTE
ncbi:MAG: KWG Leptospira [Firmicutes bacterium ADurb.Bin419]|nr:MAG: KWG Leptospira [Firmicutes bacterium ADurb.Bin419]